MLPKDKLSLSLGNKISAASSRVFPDIVMNDSPFMGYMTSGGGDIGLSLSYWFDLSIVVTKHVLTMKEKTNCKIYQKFKIIQKKLPLISSMVLEDRFNCLLLSLSKSAAKFW